MDLSEIVNPKSSSDSSEGHRSSDTPHTRLPEHSTANVYEENPQAVPSSLTSAAGDVSNLQPSSPPPHMGSQEEPSYLDEPGPSLYRHAETYPSHATSSSSSTTIRRSPEISGESKGPRRNKWRTSRSVSTPAEVHVRATNAQARIRSSGSSGSSPSAEFKGLKFQEPVMTPLTFVNTSSEGPLYSQVRTKGPNSTWTLEEERMLIDMIMATLPPFDFGKIAAILQKSDAECVRQRWEYLVKRAKRLDEDEGIHAGESNSDQSSSESDHTTHSDREQSPSRSKGKETV